MHYILVFTSLQKNMYTSNWLINFSANNMRIYNLEFKKYRKIHSIYIETTKILISLFSLAFTF